MYDRIKSLLTELNVGIFEKETEIGMSLLAALAGQSVLLLGPPGTAKSLVARRVKCAFRDARSFEYLMSRFSTPDEIFGPVSIGRLRADDAYERITEGYLPEADIVFLDEIWKAGPAILNTLLTIVNERVFRNGRQVATVPMKLLIGASNELPAEGEGLEALWDRFVVRIVSSSVARDDDFRRILLSDTPAEVDLPRPLLITAKEYASWQKKITEVGIDDGALQAILAVRRGLKSLQLSDDGTAGFARNVYVSDRRWKLIARLMRASAFVHGRAKASVADLLPCVNCLWNETDEIPAVRALVVGSLFVGVETGLEELQKVVADVIRRRKTLSVLREMQSADSPFDDSDKLIVDGFYYQIDGYATGNTVILMSDFRRLRPYGSGVYDFRRPGASPIMSGLVYADPDHKGRYALRVFDGKVDDSVAGKVSGTSVKVARDASGVYINGLHYPLRTVAPGQWQNVPTEEELLKGPSVNVEDEVERLATLASDVMQSVQSHLFVSSADVADLSRTFASINKRIARMRQTIQTVLYE